MVINPKASLANGSYQATKKLARRQYSNDKSFGFTQPKV